MGSGNSVILELQEAALNKSNDITDLLRKCLLVATKLKLDDFKNWINSELRGYTNNSGISEVPRYRKLRAQIRVHNPFNGMIPFYMPEEFEDVLCNIKLETPISNVVSIIESHRSRSEDRRGEPIFPLDSHQKLFLMERMEIPMEPVRTISVTQLDMIIDAIRSTILEWALQLEEEGILGEGMTFSSEEKRKAAQSHQIHIGNFQGVFGDVSQSEVTQNLKMEVKKGDFSSVRSTLSSKGVEDSDIDELEEALTEDATPEIPGKFGPKVSSWMGKMISKAAGGTWEIGTGAAGELIASVIAAYYGIGS